MPSSHFHARALALATLVLASPSIVGAQNPTTPAAAAGYAVIHGTVIDSLHDQLLAGALVRLDKGAREAITDRFGQYRIDSVPAGQHRLIVVHPLLDTLGVSLVTPTVTMAAGEERVMDLAVPSGETLIGLFCPPARRALGPGAVVGNVREADTETPAEGAKVSLLYYESDPLGLKKTPRVREAIIGKEGTYRICGLPASMSGKLQVFRNGVSSGEVLVELGSGVLAMRSMSISSTANVVAAAPGDTGRRNPVVRGRARVTGRVINKYGQPISGARISLQGTGAATLTRANGEFALDSLPSGTQTLEVRQLGYAPQEVAVELSASQPKTVAVNMNEYVPVLETMRVTANRERGLSDVGFAERKRTGNGYYLDSEQIAQRQTTQFSDMMRTVPGIRVVPAGNGQNVIQSSRNAMGGCVTFYVDGSPWQQQFPGDLDTFVRPEEVAAIEVYNGVTTPAQFQTAGQTGCSTIVIWTERRVNRKR